MNNKLAEIQRKIKAPKGQTNKFGGYKYRSCEDILEGVKHHLGDLSLTLDDDIVMVGDRIYVKATAKLIDGEKVIAQTSAFAREAESKKGMDASQVTGATSSYARKYALNGLFAIDDTKDSDATNNGQQEAERMISDSLVDKIKSAMKTLQLSTENKVIAIKWASGGSIGELISLTESQGLKLEALLKDKITVMNEGGGE